MQTSRPSPTLRGATLYSASRRNAIATASPPAFRRGCPACRSATVTRKSCAWRTLFGTASGRESRGYISAPSGAYANGPVLLARIQKSYAAPHMVTFQDHSRFYSRNSRGKYPLDVGEVRAAFALSESVPEKARRFRDERLARIVADETPVAQPPGPKVVLHLLPVTAFDPATRYNLGRFEYRPSDLPPLAGGGPSFRYNLDGVVTYVPPLENSPSHGYVQLFRNGTIESVESYMLRALAEERLIQHDHIEQTMISCLGSYANVQQELGLEPPIILMLSFLGVRGYRIAFGTFRDTRAAIDRDTVILPDVLMEIFRLIQPMFSVPFSTACGRPQAGRVASITTHKGSGRIADIRNLAQPVRELDGSTTPRPWPRSPGAQHPACREARRPLGPALVRPHDHRAGLVPRGKMAPVHFKSINSN